MLKKLLSFFIGIVFGVLLANGAGSDPNAIMKAIYHETTKFEDHTKNERTAINRGDTGSAIFDLKNFGNDNTNNMSSDDWIVQNASSQVLQDGNRSLVTDMINNNRGNGDGENLIFGDVSHIATGLYYSIKDGIPYLKGKDKGLKNHPWIGDIKEFEDAIVTGAVNAIDYPFEAAFGLEKGPVKTTVQGINDGLVYVVGEDGAVIVTDILTVVGTGVLVKGGVKGAIKNVGKKNPTGQLDDVIEQGAKQGGMSTGSFVDDIGRPTADFIVDSAGIARPIPSASNYTPKVIEQINRSGDLYHAFPAVVDDTAKNGNYSTIIGKDGKPFTKIEVPGAINNKQGNYEWIFNPRNNNFNHRQFVPNK